MPPPAAPVKTPLGHDELRRRTQRLGQRYRTVLLLVDGQRSLAEVLSMAHQAGAQTSHLERLVQLGMVELPQAAAEQPGPPGVQPQGAAPAAPAAEPAPAAARVAPAAAPTAAAAPNPQFDLAPEPAPESAPPRDDEETLAEVRRLLLETLRGDTLLTRAFAPRRVRGAGTRGELIDLVWQIERERAHVRRKRGQLLNLQRARDLLGMGNTLVQEAGDPAPPSTADQ